MTTPTAAEPAAPVTGPAEPRYTQGIMADGAAILDDGVLITVEQILDRLNASAMAPSAPDDIVALVDAYGNAAYWSHQMEDDSGIGVARNALLAAIGRMGGAAVPAHRDVFNGLHVERLVREWFSTPLAASVDPRLVDGLIDVLRMRLRRASPAPAHVPKSVALDDVVPLADAMWQLLDDMGADGLSVCPAAKAAARLAYEPFADVDAPLAYTVADARAVALSSTATEPSSGALPEATAADGLMGRLGRLPIVDLGIAWPDRSPAEATGDAERVAQLEGLCADYEQALTDKRRLTREIDVAMHGVDGAAKQASLCDLIEPAKRLRSERDAAEARAQAAEAEAGRLREAFQDLESTASRVAWFGPITGPHWPPLSTALVKARAALTSQGSEAAEQGDRG